MRNKYIIAYLRDIGLKNIKKEDALKLTHINVAFAKISNCELYTKLKNLDQLEKIRSFNPDLTILISIGGWGAGGFSEAASSEENRKLFSKNAIEFMHKYNLDGLDLDWEYPCYSVSGIVSSPDDKVNFTLLLKELREQLDIEEKKYNKHFLLTIATGAEQYYLDGTEMDKVHKYLDYVQLMTYDFRGGFQILTGHHTPLYNSTGDLFKGSTHDAVKLFKSCGIPEGKLVIGAAFYARGFKGVPNFNNGLFQMAETTGGIFANYDELKENYINKQGFVRYFDEEAKAPYLFNGNEFISYDDEESITYKCDYLKNNNLLGIMFWHYYADSTGTLLDTMYKNLK